MTKILIWDLPTRLFHWLLAGSFIVAFAISNLVDDDSPVFAIHMLLGGVMALMVLLRVLWGVVGSRYARFGSFVFGPAEIMAYIKGTISGGGKAYIGHNPGSSVAIWAMLGLTLGMALTGIYMSSWESLKDVHEILAYSLLAVVITHVAGVIWHSYRHQENLTMSMVSGHKDSEPSAAISTMHPIIAVVFLVITGAWAGALVQNYDSVTGTLIMPILGNTLQLGESGEGKHQPGERRAGDDDDD
jgi:cytochrome b